MTSPAGASARFSGSRVVVAMALLGASFAAGHLVHRIASAGRPLSEATPTNDAVTTRTTVANGATTVAAGPEGRPERAAIAATLTELLSEPLAHRRQLAVWNFLRTADAASIATILEELNSRPKGTRRGAALNLLFRRWGELDPTAAFAVVAAEFPASRLPFEGAVVRGWAAVDPAAAARWNLANRAHRNDAPGDFGFLEFIVASAIENRKQAELAPHIAADPVMLKIDSSVLSSFVSGWAADDPAAMVSWLNALPSESRRGATLAAMAALTSETPDLALNLANTFSNPTERGEVLARLFGQWGFADPKRARQALDQMPPGVERDTTAVALAGGLVGQHRDLAIETIATISDPKTRAGAAQTALSLIDVLHVDFDTLTRLAAIEHAASESPFALQKLAGLLGKRDRATVESYLATTPLLSAAQRELVRRSLVPVKHPKP